MRFSPFALLLALVACHPGADGTDDTSEKADSGDTADSDSPPDTTCTLAFFRDADGDGHGTPDDIESGCSAPEGYVGTDDDCDDTDPGVYTGAVETCDGVDEDCDLVVDDDAVDALVVYVDADGDGYGTGDGIASCDVPLGYTELDRDCDDTNPDIHPAAPEVADGVDNDCDGSIDEGTDRCADGTDNDADGWTDDADPDCASTGDEVGYGAWSCNDGVDDDGDGYADSDDSDCRTATDVEGGGGGGADADGDGWTPASGDCDDSDPSVHPGAAEVPDGIDNDCDGIVV